MKILELAIGGFRSLRTVTWNPGDLNVIIGPNGKPYAGIGIKAAHLAAYRDRWQTIQRKVAAA